MKPAPPWTRTDYPDGLRGMDPKVRKQAIEIANTLVEEEGYDPERAIELGKAEARERTDEHEYGR